MPWALNTPVPTPHGDLDTCKISSITFDLENMVFRITFSDGKKIEGSPPDFEHVYRKSFDIRDTPEQVNSLTGEVISEAQNDFTALIIEHPEVYALIKSIAYTAMADAGVIGPGTME
jgi:hypothetical protein